MKKYIIALTFIFTLLLSQTVSAASVSTSASKSSINPGDEFYININLSGASVATLTIRLNVDTSKVEYISGPTNSNFSGGKVIYTWTDLTGGNNPITGGNIATFKFRAKSAGNANFSITGDFYDSDENNINMAFSGTNVTIVEKVEAPPKVEENKPKEEKPNNSNTSNNTNNNVTNNNSNNKNTNNNNNSNKSISSNTNLNSLQLDIEGISPAFNKNTTEYFLVVDEKVNNINVSATPEDSKSNISISGNENLQLGSNKIVITVTAQNGSKKEYVINITKTENLENANANLENLAIENSTLVPEFSPDITEYTVEVGSEIETLNILAFPQIEEAKVTIDKPEKLNFGENNIEITVLAKDEITKKVYTINVNKKNEDRLQEENDTSDNNKIYYIVLVIVLICIIGVVTFYIMRYKMRYFKR